MKLLIIEDELPAAKKLEKLVLEVDPSIELMGVLETIDSSIEWLRSNIHPDLILMDIHLADGSSFEIFKEVKIECPVIFTTAYDEYAIDAFKVNSIDYLLKPVKRNDLELSILKFKNLRNHYTRIPDDLIGEGNVQKFKDVFVIKIGNKIKTLKIDQIAYFYSKGKLSFICDLEGRNYPLNQSLDKIQILLDPVVFFRANRQILVQRNSIKEIQVMDKSRINLKLEPATQIDAVISTEKTASFKKWLNKEN